MANNKKHHYVPYSYLKRFSKDSFHIFSLIDTGIKRIPLRPQNQKDYLYSLNIKLFGDKHNLIEDFLGKDVEGPFNKDMNETIDINIIPRNEKLVSIVWFALIQSCRPLIYKDDFEKSFELLGIKKKTNPLLEFGFIAISMINDFWQKVERCSIEILLSPEGRNFITSDNPSTLWISNKPDIYIPLTNRGPFENHKDLELIMPLNPKYLLKVYLNKQRPNSSTIWDPNEKMLQGNELDFYNKKINSVKHKNIYSIDESELERILCIHTNN